MGGDNPTCRFVGAVCVGVGWIIVACGGVGVGRRGVGGRVGSGVGWGWLGVGSSTVDVSALRLLLILLIPVGGELQKLRKNIRRFSLVLLIKHVLHLLIRLRLVLSLK